MRLNFVCIMIFGLILGLTGCDDSGSDCTPVIYSIGDTGPSGVGKVFYVTDGGLHGFEVSPQTGAMPWALAAYADIPVSGGTSTSVGSGSANTDKIIAQNGAGTDYAAGMARAYRGGGRTDWFLPSKDELALLYAQRDKLGGIDGAYWSSSERYPAHAWIHFFSSNSVIENWKTGTRTVLVIRAF